MNLIQRRAGTLIFPWIAIGCFGGALSLLNIRFGSPLPQAFFHAYFFFQEI